MHSESLRAASTPWDVQWLGTQDYEYMWHHQADLAAGRADTPDTEPGCDHLLLLEHPATYTAGKRTQPEDLPHDSDTPLVWIDRGGRITWHGPGQLVGYPIFRLANPSDVVVYVRRLEEGLIRICHELGVTSAGRIDNRSGVWLPPALVRGTIRPERKIAAIGLRITRGVAMHGFALNCNNSLEPYTHIVPCGISDAGVTTLSEELGEDIRPEDILELTQKHIIEAIDGIVSVENHDLPDAHRPRVKVQ